MIYYIQYMIIYDIYIFKLYIYIYKLIYIYIFKLYSPIQGFKEKPFCLHAEGEGLDRVISSTRISF